MSVATTTAIGLGVGLAGAAGSVASGVIGAGAAKSAANTQAGAAEYAANLQNEQAKNALDFQKQQYQTGQQNLQPWLQTGTGALSNLSTLMGINPQSPSAYPAGGTPAIPNSVTAGAPQQFNGAPATNTVSAPGINRPLSTTARVGPNGQPAGPTSPLASGPGQVPPLQTGPAAPMRGGIPPRTGGPTSQLGNGGVLNPTGGQQIPLSQLSGSPASTTMPQGQPGIDPATGFQTGTGGGPGSLNQGWNQEFQAPTAAQAAATPGYQFQLNQGLQALQNSAAAKGGLLSGNTAQALEQYGQGLASTNYQQTYNNALGSYQNAYNQFQQNQANQFNRLSALSGTGQVAAGQLNSQGQAAATNVGNISLTSGQQIGNDIQNAGAATASGYVGQANSLGGAIGGATNSIGQGLLLSQLLNKPKSTANTGDGSWNPFNS